MFADLITFESDVVGKLGILVLQHANVLLERVHLFLIKLLFTISCPFDVPNLVLKTCHLGLQLVCFFKTKAASFIDEQGLRLLFATYDFEGDLQVSRLMVYYLVV